MKPLKALSIRPPWPHLITGHIGRLVIPPEFRKDIENRDWWTKYRGTVLLHAGKTFDFEGLNAAQRILNDMNAGIVLPRDPKVYRSGGFIGTARLNDCVAESGSPWFFGKYGFKVRMARPIEFIPFRGQLGLFDVPDEISNQVKIIEST